MTSKLTVQTPRIVDSTRGSRISARIDSPDYSFEIYYDITGCSPAPDASSFLVAALPLAMAKGWTLQSLSSVSSLLLGSIPTIQNIFRFWLPGSQKIKVVAQETTARQNGEQSGAFFSGGVDSFYTILKHRASLGSLIFVTGFDIPLHKIALAEHVGLQMRAAAADLGLPLIEVKTNIRELSDKYVPWRMYHGAALASVALLMGRIVNAVFIGATHTYRDLFSCGTHPLLDPLWNTESVQLLHDGCEATRFEKVALISQHKAALDHLRVCYRNKTAEMNCGRCEKCLRTMVSLCALGVLDRCRTFANPLSIQRVARQRLGDNPNILMYCKENLSALRERHDDPHLENALLKSMRRPGLLHRLQRQSKPLFRRSTYKRLLDRSRKNVT